MKRLSAHTDGQLIGALLPDSALTGVMSWEALKVPAEAARFVAACGPELSDLVIGITHHVDLDVRSHDAWLGGGGYAYAKQTDGLRKAVKEAFNMDDRAVADRAHNLIECAVDIHLLQMHPTCLQPAIDAIENYDTGAVVAVISKLMGTDEGDVRNALNEFLSLWQTHDLSSKEGMIRLWQEMPKGNVVNEQRLSDALDIALELTEQDFQAVVEPIV